jgi:phosphate transport system substrate-binding protein
MEGRRRILLRILACTVALFCVQLPLYGQVKVQGLGATFPAPIYAKWIDTFNKQHPDVTLDFQAIGSGGGIRAMVDKSAQFGATDGPPTAEQDQQMPGVMRLPTVAGSVVLTYNMPEVTELRLNGEVIAGIYLDKIKNWRDAAIVALNPGAALPDKPIVVVHRSDGSGTTYIFTDYLCKISKEWEQKVGRGTRVEWPVGIAPKGGDGPVAAVRNISGAIGYVEYAYAKKNALPYAVLINAAGKAAQPSVDSVLAAATATFKEKPQEMLESITNSTDPRAYPICGYSWVMLYRDLSKVGDKAQAKGVVNFWKWCESDGQAMTRELGYAGLPKEAQADVLRRLSSLEFQGEKLTKGTERNNTTRP